MPGQCPRCHKQVYFAEENLVLGKSYHKMCVKCGHCNKQLDSGSVADHGGEMYCRGCYARLFGPKGYGYGVGAGVLSMDDGTSGQNGPPTSNIPSTGQAYVAPLKTAVNGNVNGNRQSPERVAPAKFAANNNVVKKNTSSTAAPPRPAFVPAAPRPAHRPAPALNGQPKWGGGTYCVRCGGAVFMAERVMAAGGAFHRACFTCTLCHRSLDSGSVRERERDVYCNACYGKNFGPKGYQAWSSAKVA